MCLAEFCMASFVFFFFLDQFLLFLSVLVCGYVSTGTQGGQRHWVSLQLKLQATPCGCWEWNLGHLLEQDALLTAEPSSRSHGISLDEEVKAKLRSTEGVQWTPGFQLL